MPKSISSFRYIRTSFPTIVPDKPTFRQCGKGNLRRFLCTEMEKSAVLYRKVEGNLRPKTPGFPGVFAFKPSQAERKMLGLRTRSVRHRHHVQRNEGCRQADHCTGRITRVIVGHVARGLDSRADADRVVARSNHHAGVVVRLERERVAGSIRNYEGSGRARRKGPDDRA